MQLAVLSVLGHQCHCPVLKSSSCSEMLPIIILLHCIITIIPAITLANNKKLHKKIAGSLADNVEKFLLKTLFGFVVFTDFTFTIVLLEDI